MTQFPKRLWHEEEAQNLPEYALLLFLVCLTAVTAMGSLATRVNSICSNVSTHVAVATRSASLAATSFSYASAPTATAEPESRSESKSRPAF